MYPTQPYTGSPHTGESHTHPRPYPYGSPVFLALAPVPGPQSLRLPPPQSPPPLSPTRTHRPPARPAAHACRRRRPPRGPPGRPGPGGRAQRRRPAGPVPPAPPAPRTTSRPPSTSSIARARSLFCGGRFFRPVARRPPRGTDPRDTCPAARPARPALDPVLQAVLYQFPRGGGVYQSACSIRTHALTLICVVHQSACAVRPKRGAGDAAQSVRLLRAQAAHRAATRLWDGVEGDVKGASSNPAPPRHATPRHATPRHSPQKSPLSPSASPPRFRRPPRRRRHLERPAPPRALTSLTHRAGGGCGADSRG